MKSLLFVLSLAASSIAYSNTPVVGIVERGPNGVFLFSKDDVRCEKLLISAKSNEANDILRKLTSGDAITASGLIDSEACTVVIENIDYVGLKRLIGYWHTNDGLISVSDFDSLNFYPIRSKDLKNGLLEKFIEPIKYRYSLTPSEGAEWVLFLSDTTSTTFATIRFGKSTATMNIYDSDTGNIKKVLRMTKWSRIVK